jgi:methylated-DNA-[protein]-cysteine S-methyltransferase
MTYDAVTVRTPFGAFTAIADEGTVVRSGFTDAVDLLRDGLPDRGADIHVRADLGRISSALRAYFAGADITALGGLPVRAEGSLAMQRLWSELRRIPAGEVRSYAELGGGRRRARAAGAACARNPIPLIVPCHRVVRADGSLGGFAGDLTVKRWLLDHEAAAVGRRPAASAAG